MNDYRAYVYGDYNSIYHHGVKGQKWGKRRYQNEDGSLTPEGYRHYGKISLGLGVGATLGGSGLFAYGAAKNDDRLKALGAALSTAGSFGGIHGAYNLSTSKDARLRDQGKISKDEFKRRDKINYASKWLAGVPGVLATRVWHDSREGKRRKNDYMNDRGHLTVKDTDGKVTKRVKHDYNNLSDKEFKKRYAVTKDRYAKRVKKYGDPYMNSPLAKIGKKLRGRKDKNKEFGIRYVRLD